MTPTNHRARAIDWRVYVILDPTHLPAGATLLDVARAALRAGAGVLQLRDKASTTRDLFATSLALLDLCRQHDACFIINDRLDLALACGAHGVHLGPHDLPLDAARRLAPDLVIGGSAGSVDAARDLYAAGADYLGVGAIFEARASKSNASPPRGPKIITDVTRVVPIPIVGIGGITAQNAAEVMRAGASGVAVIREVVGSADPAKATRALLFGDATK